VWIDLLCPPLIVITLIFCKETDIKVNRNTIVNLDQSCIINNITTYSEIKLDLIDDKVICEVIKATIS